MNTPFNNSDNRPFHAVLIACLFILCVGIAFVLTSRDIILVTGTIIALVLFAFSFMSPRIALYILIFSMLLSPEIGMRDLNKGFTLRFEDILLLIMGFAWLAKSAVFKNVGLITRTALNFPIVLYILVCTLSTSLGILQGTVKSPLTGLLFVLKYFEYFVIFFLIVNNIRTKKHIRNLFIAVFVTYIIVLINSIAQIPKGLRITAPFEGGSEPNTLGGYLLIMFSLSLVFLLSVKSVAAKVSLGMVVALCFTAILFTLSRATWLGFVPIYVMLILISNKRNILILVAIVVLAALPFVFPKVMLERLQYTFRGEGPVAAIPTPNGEMMQSMVRWDPSTEARFSSMQTVYKNFQNKPILGYGVTGFTFIDAQYHRVLIETGLIGLFAFLFLLWKTGSHLFRIWKVYRSDPLYNILTSGTFCAFLGLLFHAIGTNTFIIIRIMEPFWCLVGLCTAIPLIEQTSAEESSGDDPKYAESLSIPRLRN